MPDFPDLPMEEVYPREDPRGGAVIARETERAAAPSTSPGTSASIFWEVLAVDHGRLIANAVHWALGKTPRASRSTGQVVLDVALRENDDGLAVDPAQPHQPDDAEGPDPRDLSRSARSAVSVALDGRQASPRPACSSPVRDVAGPDRRAAGPIVEVVPASTRSKCVHLTWR